MHNICLHKGKVKGNVLFQLYDQQCLITVLLSSMIMLIMINDRYVDDVWCYKA